MKLYVLENSEGGYYDTAFLSKAVAEKIRDVISTYTDWIFEIIELEFPVIGKQLYYVKGYYGFKYEPLESPPLEDVVLMSTVYASKYSAKKDKIWTDALSKVKEIPEYYIVKDKMIAGDVGTKEKIPFSFGNYNEGNFRVTIEHIRIDTKSKVIIKK
jgi:hypothetical protein